jgi:hypothetical protein
LRSKSIAGFLVTAASLALVAHAQTPVAAADPSSVTPARVCSNMTLKGTWGSTIEGTILGPNLPFRGLALAYFDGKGHSTQVDHIVFDGMPPAQEWTPGSGTYSVNPDCTGSAVIDSPSNPVPVPIHFIIVDNGKKFIQVVDANAVIAIAYKVN